MGTKALHQNSTTQNPQKKRTRTPLFNTKEFKKPPKSQKNPTSVHCNPNLETLTFPLLPICDLLWVRDGVLLVWMVKVVWIEMQKFLSDGIERNEEVLFTDWHDSDQQFMVKVWDVRFNTSDFHMKNILHLYYYIILMKFKNEEHSCIFQMRVYDRDMRERSFPTHLTDFPEVVQ